MGDGALPTHQQQNLHTENSSRLSRHDQVTGGECASSSTNEPLPEQYDFGTRDFLRLVAHIRLQSSYANRSGYTISPLIATYENQKQRKAVLTKAIRSDRAQCKAGAAISTTVKFYPSKTGGIGIICSPLYSQDGHESEWHAVAMLRKRKTVWIFDPAYVMNSQVRLSEIPGTANIIHLLNFKAFGRVEMIQIQGVGSMDVDCMGRSAQWIDWVAGTSEQKSFCPIGTFIPGVLSHGWQEIDL